MSATAATLSPAALSALVFAQLDVGRERRGIDRCERTTRSLRKALEKAPCKISSVNAQVIALMEARKEALDAISERCLTCGRCVLAAG